MEQRLQKVLSQAGIASRRAAEKLIAEGRVTVNGRTILEMGVKVDPAVDEVRVDGSRVKSAERHRYILLGVREYVDPVGRLDYDSEGLLLMTNDGDLAAMLTHPRHGVERTYEARVAGIPDEAAVERLRRGIPLDGKRTLPADVTLLTRGRGHRELRDGNGVLVITIREGRNRQVRRMCEAIGHPVRKLTRTKIGPISDRQLKPGDWRDLSSAEVRILKDRAATPAPRAAARPRSESAR